MEYVFLLGRILFGGLCVVVGSWIQLGLACIILFLLPVTFLMHGYWSETDPMQRMTQRVHFQKNVALLGAASMLLMVSHPWPLSLHLF